MIARLQQRPAWQIHAIAAATCAVVAGAAWFAWVAPRLELRRSAERQRVALATVVGEETELQSAVAALQARVDAAKAAAKDASVANGSAAGLNGRVAQLTELAAAHGLQIDAIEPGARVTAGRQTFLPLRLSGRGGYRDVTTMLARVRTTLPDLGVDQIDLTAGGTAGAAPQFVIRFQWLVPTPSVAAR